VVLFGWACFPLAVLAAIGLTSSGRVSLRAESDPTGTTVLPDRLFGILCVAGLVTVIPTGVLFIIFVPRGEIDIPMSRGMQIFSPALMSGAVLVAVLGLITAWRRGGMGYVKLTSAGLDNANIAFTKSVYWDDVVDVKDSSEEKRTRKAIVLCLRDGSEEIVGSADLYVPTGAALYWMVRHYWKHPENRAELADGRALDRLRNEQFEAQ
jgi:hypothetical protein